MLGTSLSVSTLLETIPPLPIGRAMSSTLPHLSLRVSSLQGVIFAEFEVGVVLQPEVLAVADLYDQ